MEGPNSSSFSDFQEEIKQSNEKHSKNYFELCDICKQKVLIKEGRFLQNGTFICYNCIKRIEEFLNFGTFNRYDYSYIKGIFWVIIVFSIAPSIHFPPLFCIPIGLLVIIIILTIIEKTSNKRALRNRKRTLYPELFGIDLNKYLDFWYKKPPDWKKRREKVLERDNHSCRICGSRKGLHVHHIVPQSKKGSHKLENLVSLCPRCHSDQPGHSQGLEIAFERGERIKEIIYTSKKELKARKYYECYICECPG
jgi:hypothetical protein